jgi:hypothetical protein
VDLANLSSESEMCVGSRVRLVGVSISFENNFSAPIHSPLSGSLYQSFSFSVATLSAEKERGEKYIDKRRHRGELQS